MSNTVTCVYHVKQGGGLSLSALATAVGAVPTSIIANILSALGIRITSDTTSSGSGAVTRTIVFSLVPSTAAGVGAVQLNANNIVVSAPVTSPGTNYVLPPTVTFAGGDPMEGGDEFQGAAGGAFLSLVNAVVTSPGSGYSAQTFATVVGQLPPNNPRAEVAQLSLTIVAGAITGIAISDPGSHYIGVPVVVITDPTGSGSGGAISLSLGVEVVDVVYPGQGYEFAPTLVLTPAYKSFFPDGKGQDAPFFNLMKAAIEEAIHSPVVADAPVLS